jgi:hypothetical protein
MIKVFGHPASTCTRKVLMTLAETNTPFELTTIDFAKGEHKQQPHLSRQPFGQIRRSRMTASRSTSRARSVVTSTRKPAESSRQAASRGER